MKIFFTTLTLLVILTKASFSQVTYYAQKTGLWSDNSVWNTKRDGSGTPGVPTANDEAYTEGWNIFIFSENAEVGDLFVKNTGGDQIQNGSTDLRSLTINGTLSGYELAELFPGGPLTSKPSEPTSAVFSNDPNLKIIFTGTILASSTTPVISTWSHDAPLNNARFEPLNSSTTLHIEDLSLSGGMLIVSNGTLKVNSGFSISNSSSSTISVASGGVFTINGAVNGGTTADNFGIIDINGVVNIGPEGYMNVNTLNISSGGVLNINSAAIWHVDASGPASSSIDENSTVNYNRELPQEIAARTYGNLSITTTGSGATKTLSGEGAGTLLVQGDFTIGSSITFESSNTYPITFQGNVTNNGIWTTSAGQEIIFNGSGLQVGGSQPITFNGSVTASTPLDFNTAVTFASNVDAGANNLSFSKNFTNNGTLNGTGTVIFDGSSNQSIGGTTATIFENLTISNTSATATVSSSAAVKGTLTLSPGSSLNANGQLTLLSNGSATANVAAIPSNANLAGNVIYERFIGNGGETWRYLGLPFGGSVSDLTTAGLTINGNDLAYYDEAATGTIDDGWVLQSTFGTSISGTQGYSIWTREEDIPATIRTTGALNEGNVTLTTDFNGHGVLENDGWNLVNNPYASTIDWGAGGWTKTNIDAVAYVLDNGNYTALPGSPGSFIASGQAFFVKASGSNPVLTATQNVKVGDQTSFLRTNETQKDWVKITLSDGENVDKTDIRFINDATEEFDSKYDGYKLSNSIYNLSSKTQAGMDLSINSLPVSGCSRLIDLNITNISPGDYEFKFQDITSLTIGTQVTLIDNYLNQRKVLSEGEMYAFAVTADATSYGDDRFDLEFGATEIDETIDFNADVAGSCEDYVTVNLNNTQHGISYSVLNAANEMLSTPEISTGGELQLYIPHALLGEGVNSFSVKASGNASCTSDYIAEDLITYEPVSVYNIETVTGSVICGDEGSTSLIASGAGTDGFYRWYESADSPEPINGNNSAEFVTNSLSATTTFFVTAVNAQGCESERKPVTAKLVNVETPAITAEGQTLIAPTAEGYQWYNGTEPITGATGQEFTVTETGYFTVEVFRDGCSAKSEGREFVVTGVDDALYKMGLNIYPNPVVDRLNFSSIKNVIDAHETNISLFDGGGRMVRSNADLKAAGNGGYYLPVEGIRKGTYILNVESKNKTLSLHILKR